MATKKSETYKPINTKPTRRKRQRDELAEMDKEAVEEGLGSFQLIEEADGSFTAVLVEEGETLDEVTDYISGDHYQNLVPLLDKETLDKLGMQVVTMAQEDDASRSEWMDTIAQGLNLLGIKLEEKNEPFRGACSAQHPLLMESAVKFQSKASNELLPANGPVRTRILGDQTAEKEQQAIRVQNHMNYQLLEEMPEFYTDSERMLLQVGLMGSGFKKTYYDAYLERPVSEFVPADQLIVPNNASDLRRSERYTHILYRTHNQLQEAFAQGLYEKPTDIPMYESEYDLTPVKDAEDGLIGVQATIGDASQGYTLYEQHVLCCIPGLDDEDEDYALAKPYIITVDKNSYQVLGIRRNWRPDDPKRQKRLMFTHFTFVPGFGFYGLGLLHLLGNLQLSLTSTMRSLVDAGQFANLQGGFKLKGVRILNDGEPIYPGQFKDVDAAIMDIHKSIMPLPFKEPSQTLMAMFSAMTSMGQKFADSTESVIADSTNYGPVGTTLALLDASTKFFSAIHKRLHHSLKDELRLIAEINADTLRDETRYNIENESMAVFRKDYDDTVDVIPVSDPNISSSAHRMAKAQTVFQLAQQSPDVHDMREVLKHIYVNMDVDYTRLLPEPEEAEEGDPVTDIHKAIQGKPIKAFPGQDHQAHIAVKEAFLQDPLSGGKLNNTKAAMAIAANIQEHLVMSFASQLEAQAQNSGAPIEQAAQMVAQMNQQKLEQQTQQGRDQTAGILAEAELLDSKTKARKQRFDEAFKTAELELKKEMLDMQKLQEARRSDEFKTGLLADFEKLVSTKALDAMVEGLNQRNDKKVPESARNQRTKKE